jgi:hypothetical protein
MPSLIAGTFASARTPSWPYVPSRTVTHRPAGRYPVKPSHAGPFPPRPNMPRQAFTGRAFPALTSLDMDGHTPPVPGRLACSCLVRSCRTVPYLPHQYRPRQGHTRLDMPRPRHLSPSEHEGPSGLSRPDEPQHGRPHPASPRLPGQYMTRRVTPNRPELPHQRRHTSSRRISRPRQSMPGQDLPGPQQRYPPGHAGPSFAASIASPWTHLDMRGIASSASPCRPAPGPSVGRADNRDYSTRWSMIAAWRSASSFRCL